MLTPREIFYLNALVNGYTKEGREIISKGRGAEYEVIDGKPLFKEEVQSLIDRGYCKVLKGYMGPFRHESGTVFVKITEAGETVLSFIQGAKLD